MEDNESPRVMYQTKIISTLFFHKTTNFISYIKSNDLYQFGPEKENCLENRLSLQDIAIQDGHICHGLSKASSRFKLAN